MTNPERMISSWQRLAWALILINLIIGTGVPLVSAKTIYSYLDEQGNMHATDNPETIPERYQAKVRTHEQPDPVAPQPTTLDNTKQTVQEQLKGWHLSTPNLHRGALPLPQGIQLSGLSPAQSQILTYAGAAALFLIALMYLTKSSMLRLLSMGLLLILVIGAPLMLYLGDDGLPDTFKNKVMTATGTQEKRLNSTAP